MRRAAPGDAEYRRLLRFRTALRRFLRWSEEEAVAAGATGPRHQLLLAVRGSASRGGPTVGEIAEALLLRHHSAVGLVDRAAAAGLVRRVEERGDRRIVRVRLTPRGAGLLRRLSERHLEELRRLAPAIGALAGRGAASRPAGGDPSGKPDGGARDAGP